MIITNLAELPPEIYSAILTQVPTDERQQTALSLSRAIPRSPVPLHHLFECIRLKTCESVFQLYRSVRGSTEKASWVRSFALEAWTVDADTVVNLLSVLTRLHRITLYVGPNFAPEYLEEILEKPREDLLYLSLRFRPYVQRATYYQFLKGAYFDTALQALSQWPSYNLRMLSIVQDPLDPEVARAQRFAQPLVFFHFDVLTKLVCSPCFRSASNLRLRIPSRQVAPFLFNTAQAVPALSLLDLSTCHVRFADVEGLIARFSNLKHLILNGCTITQGQSHEGDWVAVGKMVALGTVKAAKDREKKLKTWLENNAIRLQISEAGTTEQPTGELRAGRRIRPGRRGLATATISLRDSPPREAAHVSHRNISVPKIRVLPTAPTICSLSTTLDVHSTRDAHTISTEFQQGWEQGIAQLSAIRSRLYQSWKNEVRVMYISDDQGMEDGFEGLRDIDSETHFHDVQSALCPVPVLCLAGFNLTTEHAEGCGHAAASRIWDEVI
ncbi:hypothetical protein EDC04DRAFT_2556271 [Pisolithus marmoratus]|nr:hypothetical protein EDC04DRAFT_2556271 [Pisolithus marmoratus]